MLTPLVTLSLSYYHSADLDAYTGRRRSSIQEVISSLHICTHLSDVYIVGVGEGAVSCFHALRSEVISAVVHSLLDLHIVRLTESGSTAAPTPTLL